jgi:hypothetical protein
MKKTASTARAPTATATARTRTSGSAKATSAPAAVWRLRSRVRPEALPLVRQMAQLLAPLGVAWSEDAEANQGNPGPDAGVLMRRHQWPAVELSQDGTNYFDVHHTVHDTLDRVDLSTLPQNVACWAVTALAGGASAGGVWAAAQVDPPGSARSQYGCRLLLRAGQHEGTLALRALTTVARLLAGRHLGQHLGRGRQPEGIGLLVPGQNQRAQDAEAGHRCGQQAGPAHVAWRVKERMLVHVGSPWA